MGPGSLQLAVRMAVLAMLGCALLALLLVVSARLYLLLRKRMRPGRSGSVSLLVVAGSGGHTSEILRLLSCLSHAYSPTHYVVAESDTMSEDKICRFEKARAKECCKSSYSIHRIPRSREVLQSWSSSVLTTLHSMFYCLILTFKLRPDVEMTKRTDDSIQRGWMVPIGLQVSEARDRTLLKAEKREVVGPVGKLMELYPEPLLVANAIKASLPQGALKSTKDGTRRIQVEITPTSSRISRNAVTSMSIRGHRWKRHEQPENSVVQKLFLDKIREYDTKSKQAGGPVDAGPDYQKDLNDDLAKLQRLYGGGDLKAFPEFKFEEPKFEESQK